MVYDGRGKAVRNWHCFDVILRSLEAKELSLLLFASYR
ncbi:MAG: hypothetical protein OEW09_02385 [Anaerolineae bacterium]|nr:hypothetical protein [Anaerolineae bacterium]